MASVIFYPDKEKKGKTLLLISFTFNHKRLRLSSGVHVPVVKWDQETQKVKPLKDFADENKRLRETVNFFLDKYDELFPKGIKMSEEEVNRKAEEMNEAFKVFTGRKKASVAQKVTLYKYFDVFKERFKNRITKEHLDHYDGLKTHLEEFEKKNSFRIDFDTIGREFYFKFTDYLRAKPYKPNTIGSHIKRIKRLMNEAILDNLTSNREHQKRYFKAPKEDADTIFLNETEIRALYEMEIEFPGYRRIRDLFVLNCYTGLRHSDWPKVLKEKIQDKRLYVKTDKTKEPVIIPVKPLVKEILDKYENIYIPSNQKTNDSLKWIGQKAHEKKLGNGNFQKWLEIRTHTARRSFATNAYLSGIPMRDIMQITGHRTTDSFLKYIRVTKIETAEKLKDHPFFS
jgi:site-specific recombinase XerD